MSLKVAAQSGGECPLIDANQKRGNAIQAVHVHIQLNSLHPLKCI